MTKTILDHLKKDLWRGIRRNISNRSQKNKLGEGAVWKNEKKPIKGVFRKNKLTTGNEKKSFEQPMISFTGSV